MRPIRQTCGDWICINNICISLAGHFCDCRSAKFARVGFWCSEHSARTQSPAACLCVASPSGPTGGVVREQPPAPARDDRNIRRPLPMLELHRHLAINLVVDQTHRDMVIALE